VKPRPVAVASAPPAVPQGENVADSQTPTDTGRSAIAEWFRNASLLALLFALILYWMYEMGSFVERGGNESFAIYSLRRAGAGVLVVLALVAIGALISILPEVVKRWSGPALTAGGIALLIAAAVINFNAYRYFVLRHRVVAGYPTLSHESLDKPRRISDTIADRVCLCLGLAVLVLGIVLWIVW